MKIYIDLKCESVDESRAILNKQTGEINMTKFILACSNVVKEAYAETIKNDPARHTALYRLCRALDVVEEALIKMHPHDNINYCAHLVAPQLREVIDDAEE